MIFSYIYYALRGGPVWTPFILREGSSFYYVLQGGYLLLRSTRWIYHALRRVPISKVPEGDADLLSQRHIPASYDPRGGCLLCMLLETDLCLFYEVDIDLSCLDVDAFFLCPCNGLLFFRPHKADACCFCKADLHYAARCMYIPRSHEGTYTLCSERRALYLLYSARRILIVATPICINFTLYTF